MDYIALDTDVASNLIKRRVPPALLAKLASYTPCVSFVTLGELTEWAIVRDMWNAACCLAENLPLATLNVKDYQDFAEHGLKIVTSY